MASKKSSIILIGMPGVGKSTAGVVLAKILGCKFIDSDLLIQEREGRLLKEIIADEGSGRFIRIENEVNASINDKRSVIATGGSVIFGEEAMEHLRSIGTVVYLRASQGTLSERLQSLDERGVVFKSGGTLADIFAERTPLYEKYADVTVETDGLSINGIVDAIMKEVDIKSNAAEKAGD